MTFVFSDEKCGECDVRKQTIKVGKSTNDEAIYGYLLMTIFEWLSPLMRTKIPQMISAIPWYRDCSVVVAVVVTVVDAVFDNGTNGMLVVVVNADGDG